MPLIIESYYSPYTRIADLLFPKADFVYIDRPVSEPADGEVYCYTREERSREIKYYFNKIFYIEKNKIVCLHKTAKQIKYYDVETGRVIKFREESGEDEPLDKSGYLPQLEAQKGDLVLFPDEDDEI